MSAIWDFFVMLVVVSLSRVMRTVEAVVVTLSHKLSRTRPVAASQEKVGGDASPIITSSLKSPTGPIPPLKKMAPRPRTSAAGVLALLSEPDAILKQHALRQLEPLVPQFWAEISEHVAEIEALYESEQLPKDARDLAALVSSKVYYYLGEYDEALSFALGAGKAFDAQHGDEEYTETVVSKAIDRYIQLRTDEENGQAVGKIDPRLQDIIEGIFTRCINDSEHRQALGIALESARLDVITRIYELTKDTRLLSYVIDSVLDSSFKLAYRNKVLYSVIPLFPPPTAQSPHIHSLTRLHVTLSSPSLTTSFLTSLVSESRGDPTENRMIAYQFAFDLVEGGSQDYIEALRSSLPQDTPSADGTAMTDDSGVQAVYNKLRKILSGDETIRLYLDFLKRNNRTDLLILKNSKDALDGRSSIYHNALTLQNAYMHCGTTSDIFLRNNLDWLGRASNWSKFSATAALGVINKGNISNGMRLLAPYLPTGAGGEGGGGNSTGQYSEGGALYALGLIHAGKGREVIGYLKDRLKEAASEVVQHGAALGLGVAGLASGNQDAYDELRTVLFTDSAVASEAAGYAMGLVMLGSRAERCVDEMLQYARETQHEKIIRGLAMGIAFIFYGRQEQADVIIENLLSDKDPILRYGGVYTLALAYAGTADNGSVKKLLHIAVSDTSDDVRRAAVTSLAFLLFKNPSQVPRLVQLLSESYNPHVRCGATLALGLACAGTGSQDAIDLLEPMTKDPVDFVRQGAFISLAMILIQQTEVSCPSVTSTRALFAKVIADKHEDPMARFGACVAQGLIDAGGRNVTVGLKSRGAAGGSSMSAIVGMALFCQFWYWYPLSHCASLAFEPTAIIGVTESLQTPSFEFVSNARPSLFTYPAPTKPPTKEAIEKVATAVLSTTAKAKAREKEKEKEKAKEAESESMDTDDKPTDIAKDDDTTMKPAAEQPEASSSTPTKPATAEETKANKKPKEPSSERLQNLSRVTPAQLVHITFPPDGRWQPVRAVSTTTSPAPPSVSKKSGTITSGAGAGGGILMLLDKTPSETVSWIEPVGTAQESGDSGGSGDADTRIIPVIQTNSNGVPVRMNEGSGSGGAPSEADPPPPFEYPFGNDGDTS